MRLTTRQVTRGALLVSTSLVLNLTRLGEIQVPTPARAITIAHVPVVLAGIAMGPWAGGLVGLIWGFCQWSLYGTAFPDPLLHILPRIGVGVVSAWVFAGLRRFASDKVAAGTAAVAGTLTNTVGVLGMAVRDGFMPRDVAIGTAALHLPLEILAAVIITVPVVARLISPARPAPSGDAPEGR